MSKVTATHFDFGHHVLFIIYSKIAQELEIGNGKALDLYAERKERV